jgi:hypothetical protein
MTTHNNDVLYAAAIAGITAGVNDGKDFSQITSASLTASAAQTAAIAAIATEIDTAIPNDTSISVVSTGLLSVSPQFAGSGTAAQILPTLTKPSVLFGLCVAAFRGKGDLTSASASTYLAIATGIALQYNATVAQLPAS